MRKSQPPEPKRVRRVDSTLSLSPRAVPACQARPTITPPNGVTPFSIRGSTRRQTGSSVRRTSPSLPCSLSARYAPGQSVHLQFPPHLETSTSLLCARPGLAWGPPGRREGWLPRYRGNENIASGHAWLEGEGNQRCYRLCQRNKGFRSTGVAVSVGRVNAHSLGASAVVR